MAAEQHQHRASIVVHHESTIATNIIFTTLIVIHLLQVRRKVRKTVSAMLVEAAFLYTAFGLAFLVPYAMGSTANLLFFPMLGQIQVRGLMINFNDTLTQRV